MSNSDGFFVHDKGICDSKNVGEGTTIWAFAHVLSGAKIGKNCNICDHVFVENDVVIGDDVTIKCGVQIWDGVRLGDRVFIGPNATFTNDIRPRSKQYPDTFAQTIVEDDASIGANATILPNLTISRGAMVGAGAVVTRSVPPYAIVAGNPAKIIGYEGARAETPAKGQLVNGNMPAAKAGSRRDLGVGGSYIERLPFFGDSRGDLAPIEFEQNLPFIPRRSFLVYNVPSEKVRGEHAHKVCQQFLIAVSGSISVVVDDLHSRAEVTLDNPSLGLLIPPMVWGIQYKFSAEAALMVFASHPYDNDDYIRSYSEFTQLRGVAQ